MSGTGILNADMATVTRWLREGFAWWTEELAGLLPPALRGMGSRRGPVAIFSPGKPITVHPGGTRAEVAAGGRLRQLVLAVPASLSLQRDCQLPAMRASDLRSYVTLEADRLLPLGSQNLLADALPVTAAAGAGQPMTVRIAAIERHLVEQALAAATAAGIAPTRFGIVDDNDPARLRFDFGPQLRAEGLLPPPDRQRQFWWGLVALAFIINLGLLVLRDQQSVTRLREIVDEQQPAVAVYRTIASRTARAEQVAHRTVSRHASHAALADLAAATTALPPEAWVQRYDWNGQSLHLAGYMRPSVDVVAALRREPRFINVRTSNADVQADIPIGQPFDVTADIRNAHR